MTTLEPGTHAPAFSSRSSSLDQGEERVSLTERDFRGRPLVPPPVQLVEFGDYQCPYSRRAHPIVKQLVEQFGDRLAFRFRNFPLSQIHPQAQHAAEAAVSVRSQAGEQAFWAMHNAIFTHQRDSVDALDDAHLARYAELAGADGTRVRSDLDTGKFAEAVEVDFVEGVRMGVNGTPRFFINGALFEGDWRDIKKLAAAIEEADART